MSEFKNLYKNQSNLAQQQSLRRAKLLEEQKQRRENQFSSQRDIKSENEQQKKKKIYKDFDYKNNLMLSEWMMETPEDLEDFLLIPCPKGIRSTLSNEKTKNKNCRLYYKNGTENLRFKTNLPQQTILDCILDKISNTLFILDVIKYDGRDFMNCDTSFRHFWIKNKFIESDLKIIDEESDMKMQLLDVYDLADSNQGFSCFQKYPMFNEGTELDGFLFYHKEADYTIGETPLVLWLFPFMIEEVLSMFKVHPNYNNQKPDNYRNYLDYIKIFNETLKKKRRSRNKSESSMEIQENQDENEFDMQNEIQKMIDLERFG
ncbi:hypothetical protein PVAND_017079 [Polypedilum vanderplanki]|uniref:Snurportin-1 n=1 Tax=Polypedilum vanderplanki TaxID=319348 RepID=A0A9J6BH30_POLVA|nr:hypothetical protein PVAND_017079 [Polypedilum vanderplanki]